MAKLIKSIPELKGKEADKFLKKMLEKENPENFDDGMTKVAVKEEIFWLDGFEGKCKGGIFVRNPLVEFFEKCEKQGIKIVGIKKPDDWNMELIVEVKEKTNGNEN